MAAVAPDITKFYNKESSKSTSFSANLAPIRVVSTANATISEGILIYSSNPKMSVKVLKSFSVQILHVEEGYVATSSISDIYELGDFIGEAVRIYLYSLVDELVWLQERKEHLSAALLQQLDRIQSHLIVVG